jgi:uncharacterized membrane protein YsdA (DUF1294 family)
VIPARRPDGRPSGGGIQHLKLKLAGAADRLRVAAVRLAVDVAARHLAGAVDAYGVVSVLAFFMYWADKRKARADAWRTPENILHALELAGGWPGALIAQQVFRHKTRKVSFQILFWVIVALHQVFWIDQLFLGANLLSLF